MKTVSKILALALTLLMLITIVSACNNETEESSTQTPTPPASESAGTEGEVEQREDYIIQIFVEPEVVLKDSTESEVGKYIYEKFGIIFEYIPYAGDAPEKQSLMLAAGDYPEMMWLTLDTMVMNYISAGALVSLEPYLDKMPDFVDRFRDVIPYWRIPGDGVLYKWEEQIPIDFANVPPFDMIIRSDLLEQQGWTQPVSTSEWLEFLRQAKADNPVTPEGLPTVGATMPLAEAYGLAALPGISFSYGDTYTFNNYEVIFNIKTRQWVNILDVPEVKESFKFWNTLYKEGLFDEECFTDTGDKTAEKMSNGQALSAFYVGWYNAVANSALVDNGKEEMTYISLPMQLDSQVAAGQPRLTVANNTTAYGSRAITINARYPERLIELINWAATEEGQLLMLNGFESIHYERNSEGKRVPTQLRMDIRLDFESLLREFGSFKLLPNFPEAYASDGQCFNMLAEPEFGDEAMSPREQEVFKKLGWANSQQWFIDNGMVYRSDITTVSIDPASDLGRIQQRMADVRIKYSAGLLMAGSDDEFEDIWNQMLAEFDLLDHKAVVDEYNRIYGELADLVEMYKLK